MNIIHWIPTVFFDDLHHHSGFFVTIMPWYFISSKKCLYSITGLINRSDTFHRFVRFFNSCLHFWFFSFCLARHDPFTLDQLPSSSFFCSSLWSVSVLFHSFSSFPVYTIELQSTWPKCCLGLFSFFFVTFHVSAFSVSSLNLSFLNFLASLGDIVRVCLLACTTTHLSNICPNFIFLSSVQD